MSPAEENERKCNEPGNTRQESGGMPPQRDQDSDDDCVIILPENGENVTSSSRPGASYIEPNRNRSQEEAAMPPPKEDERKYNEQGDIGQVSGGMPPRRDQDSGEDCVIILQHNGEDVFRLSTPGTSYIESISVHCQEEAAMPPPMANAKQCNKPWNIQQISGRMPPQRAQESPMSQKRFIIQPEDTGNVPFSRPSTSYEHERVFPMPIRKRKLEEAAMPPPNGKVRRLNKPGSIRQETGGMPQQRDQDSDDDCVIVLPENGETVHSSSRPGASHIDPIRTRRLEEEGLNAFCRWVNYHINRLERLVVDRIDATRHLLLHLRTVSRLLVGGSGPQLGPLIHHIIILARHRTAITKLLRQTLATLPMKYRREFRRLQTAWQIHGSCSVRRDLIRRATVLKHKLSEEASICVMMGINV